MFLSLPFVILFTCCLILYYTVKGNYRKPVLLLASGVFIGYFNIAYLLIAALIAAITFYWGRWIGMQEQENKRRRVFIGGIVFLILFLVAFKYLNFIGENIAVLLGWFGVDWREPSPPFSSHWAFRSTPSKPSDTLLMFTGKRKNPNARYRILCSTCYSS